MSDASYERWLTAQKAAVANFQPIRRVIYISKCPSCYGGIPQGSNSAHEKGCYDCRVFEECGKASERVNDASMTEKEWKDKSIRYKELMSENAWRDRFGSGYKGV